MTVLIILHFLVSIVLMIVILLQSSKGGGMAGVFGGSGGGMGAVFGGRGAASFLSKLTTILAAIFLGFALLISYVDKGQRVDQNVVAEELENRRLSSPASVLPTVQDAQTTPGETAPAGIPAQGDTSK